MEQSERKPKERDFLCTREGMFFCVTGYLHPPDRYTAYLKYSPAAEGKWRDAKTSYRRELPYDHVETVAATLDWLEANYPHYVGYCPVRDIRFSLVPHGWVTRYCRPEERLAETLANPQDRLEEEICRLLDHLHATSGLPADVFGVTGSVLTGFHNPDFSDIDLLIHGAAPAFHLRRCIQAGSVPELRPPGPERSAAWCKRIQERFDLTAAEAAYLARRRWNYGFFGPRYVSIHATRTDAEISEAYGDRIYRRQGIARIRAVLADVSAGLFLPAVYPVQEVELLDGDPAARQVQEIVLYEGLFSDIAEAGQAVVAHGKLETVNGEPRRLVIGATELAGGGSLRPAQLESAP